MITEHEFQRVAAYVKDKAGINLNEKKVLVQGRLDSYMQRKGYQSYDEFMNRVERFPTGPEAEDLMNALTTNHTYFWREYEQFLFLKQEVFPELKNRTKDWHIWCAASSTGEEPYTLAMLCKDFLGLEHSEWDTKILATDIDTKVLEKAVRGVYAKNSVEQLPHNYVRRFFKQISADEYQVRDELKCEVIYRQLNLMNQLPFKKPLHVVFIRNVMIYFDQPTKDALVKRFFNATVPGGYLFIGHSEGLNKAECPYQYVMPAIYQKKG